MAILKSTQIKGDLTVTGSLNVQGNLTYVGVENLRVKDHQIELNANDKGSASLAGADKAGIVIRGAQNTTKNPNSEEASILYNHANDSLVINKTIEGTVSNATTAASADKVAQKLTVNVTNELGTTNTVEFDGSAEKTVSVDLSGLQNQINSLTGGAGSIATQINDAINKLDAPDAAVDGQYVSSVSEENGKITVTRAALPDYTEVYDAKGAAATAEQNAKTYADGLASNYDAAGTAAQALVDAKAYTDGKVNGKFDATGSAAQALADAKTYVDNKVDGKFDATGSAATAKTEAIAQANSYTDTKIGELRTAAYKDVLTGAIADSPSSDNLVTAAQVKAYADGLNTTMDGRVAKLEAIDHKKLADDASADAVAKVVAGAPESFDTLKEVADWIKNDKTGAAALQTNVSQLQAKVTTLEGASHTHDNKAELDKIADGDKAKWDNHVANANIHVTAEQKKTWDAKQNALTNADVLAAITSTHVSNWDDAASKAHEHANKTVLDGITADKVAAWDGAVSAAGVSSVGGKAGALTLKGGSKTLGDVNLSISDGGEISAAIVPDSFDVKGAANTALANAKTYADEKVAELRNTVDSLSNDVLKGVAAGDYVSVSTKSGNSQTISVTTKDVATASDSANGLALAADVKKYVDGKNADQDTKIANIENGKTLDSRYVNADGDTMTGKLTMNAADIEMPSNGTNGIVFGNMKIVWNVTDSAIEFIPTTA